MEEKTEAIITVQTATARNSVAGGGKKKRGAMHLFRVAMFMLRQHSGKSKAVEVGSKGKWKQMVGSMRPLHLQSNQSPPSSVHGGPTTVPTFPEIEYYEDVLPMPFSPGASSSSNDMSRYASAINLQELDRSENRDNEEEENGVGGRDEMIDTKAEMFIAQFYEQMKLQRIDSIHHYNQRIQRSME